MTTIAYRDGVLAADSRAARGNAILPGKEHKLFRIGHGAQEGICGACGDAPLGRRFVEWLQARITQPDLTRPETWISNDIWCAVIVVWAVGEPELYEGNGVTKVYPPFFAMGSGAMAALGAMHAGADAVRAVWAAAQVDPWTGGDIVSMRIDKQLTTKADRFPRSRAGNASDIGMPFKAERFPRPLSDQAEDEIGTQIGREPHAEGDMSSIHHSEFPGFSG